MDKREGVENRVRCTVMDGFKVFGAVKVVLMCMTSIIDAMRGFYEGALFRLRCMGLKRTGPRERL